MAKQPSLKPTDLSANDIDQVVKDRIVNELDRNFLVQAVPGSGKTYNLVQRMIAIILSGRPANGIAAITFTRKAAEELHNRLREMMESRLVDAPAYEQAMLEQGLVDIEDGYVGTIHGFCAGILREYPVEARLDPAFVEIEEADEREFFRQTLAEILTADPFLLRPFSDHEVDPEEEMIINGLQRFCQYPDIDFSISGKIEVPDARPLLQAFSECWQQARSFDPRPHLSMVELQQQAEDIKQWRNLEKIAGQLQKFCEKSALDQEDLKVIRRTIRFYGNPKLVSSVDTTAKKILDTCNTRIKEECQKFRDEYCVYLFPQILPLLNQIREKEQQWRNQRGYVSYLDLLSRTVQLLKDAPHVRKAVRQRFPVLMIDEFQDTDPLQAEMAFLLAAENVEENNWLKTKPVAGSLFLVGDPKQSIYRFRRADINIYLEAAAHLKETGGEILTLKQNRRSLAGVCNWVDQAFKPVFTAQAASGQAPFDEMSPLRGKEGHPAVKALELPGSIRGNATAQMADYDSEKYAEIISRLLQKPDPAIKDGAPLAPDDFMILCRKNDELVKYALWLEERGIGVNLSGGGPSLAATLEKDFRPLYWLLRALSDSNDAAVVYAVLTGPIFGCSDEEIYDYRNQGGFFSCSMVPDGKDRVSSALRKMCRFRKWMQELVPGAAFRRIVSSIKYDAWLLLRDFGLLKTAF
ncbi:MAG: UvrD-helicase domain-containing protein, partial [Candidatus Riflebacteria bacterium]